MKSLLEEAKSAPPKAKKLAQDGELWETVRELRTKGFTYQAICDWLGERGIKKTANNLHAAYKYWLSKRGA